MFIESLFVPETGCQGLHISQHFSKWGPMKPVSLSFSFFYFDLFIYFYFWLRRVFVAACGLSRVAASGGYSLLPHSGFSLQWLLLLRSTGSRHLGFRSCSGGL